MTDDKGCLLSTEHTSILLTQNIAVSFIFSFSVYFVRLNGDVVIGIEHNISVNVS